MRTWVNLLNLMALAFAQSRYTEPSGIIYSPNYPSNYSDNMNVTYTIVVQPGNYVHLTFLQFETEQSYDELQIFGQTSDTVLHVSGHQTGETFNVMATEVVLMFTTDLTNTYQGFAIQYESLKVGTFYTPTNNCPDQIHDSQFGIITSPNWPDKYPNNFTCTYYLVTVPRHKIRLQFLSFVTEAAYDVVEIYDGYSAEFPLLGQFSGNKTFPTVESTGSSMFIVFSTDLVNNFQGFSALYIAVSKAKPTTEASLNAK